MPGEATARTPAAAPVWPDKMITQGEAFAKAASWPIKPWIDFTGERPEGAPADIVLQCDHDGCGQSVGQLRRGGVTYNGSLDEILAMVLRHMVMAHDVPLNTRAPAPESAGRIPGPPALGPGKRRYGSV
jgi:hypothetical protein